LNIGVICGTDVVVLDIDPRHGGNETLAALIAENEPLPRTWLVATGGGGHHYYFAPPHAPYASAFRYKDKGVELKGAGGYVVGPTSLHVSGEYYEWLVSPYDCELAPLPDWVGSVCKPVHREGKRNAQGGETEPTEYTLDEVVQAVAHLDPNMSYMDWVTVGMGIHSAGLEFSVWDEWSSKGSTYPGSRALAKKWNSFHGNGLGVGTLIHMAREAGWEPIDPPLLFVREENSDKKEAQAVEPEQKLLQADVEERCSSFCMNEQPKATTQILDPQGLISEISAHLYNNAIRSYEHFSTATSLSIMSSVAQGSYLTPDGRCLSLYQVCLLPAAGGKEDYIKGARNILREVDARIVCSHPGSSHGLRCELYSFNSRFWAVDEAQDFFSKVSSTDNVFLKQLLSDLKELHNGIEVWDSQIIKSSSVPAVKYPRVTWLGFGTPKKFKETINSDSVGGGLLSRFMVWDIPMPCEKKVKDKSSIDKEIIGKLRRIMTQGITENGKGGVPKMLEARNLFQAGKASEQDPQVVPRKRMKITDDADTMVKQYERSCEKVYLGNPEGPGAAVIDRGSANVLKCACLHALGCNRTTVEPYDVRWALSVVTDRVADLVAISTTWMADNMAERDRCRIVDSLKRSGGKSTRRALLCNLRISAKELDVRLFDLVEMGQVEIRRPSGELAAQKFGAWPNACSICLTQGRERP
jgi:hypothetical protein